MDISVIIDSVPEFAKGIAITVEITAISVAIGFCLAIVLSIMRVSKNPFVWMPVYGFNFYFRDRKSVV